MHHSNVYIMIVSCNSVMLEMYFHIFAYENCLQLTITLKFGQILMLFYVEFVGSISRIKVGVFDFDP